MTEQEKLAKRMNERLDAQEKGLQTVKKGIGLYLGCMAAAVVFMVLCFVIGAIWVALFGPSRP